MKLKKSPNFSYKSGFTLIELLVVIFIIGILVSLLLANILGARQRAEDVEKKNNLQQMKRALRLYYNDNQRYPAPAEIPDVGAEFSVDGGEVIYIKEVPVYDDYSVDTTGDRFVMTVTLDNASDKSIAESQSRCSTSLSAVTSTPDVTGPVYVVCED